MAALLLLWLLSCSARLALAQNLNGACVKANQDCYPGKSRCCSKDQQCVLKLAARNNLDGSCGEPTPNSSSIVPPLEASPSGSSESCLSLGHPAITPLGWLYYGCHSDLGHFGLDVFSSSATNNNRNCAKVCTGYQYFGTANGTTCLCGNSLAGIQTSDGACCNQRCAGTSLSYTDICGSSTSITLWKSLSWSPPIPDTPSITTIPIPALISSTPPLTTPTPGIPTLPPWSFYGCFYSSRIQVDLGYTIGMPHATNAVCARLCSGYQYFGTAEGFLCHCGNTVNMDFERRSEGCTAQCEGNTVSVEFCGGDEAISVFRLDGAGAGS